MCLNSQWIVRLILFLCTCLLSAAGTATDSSVETSCPIPPNGTHPELQKCYRMGHTLLNNYVDYMRRREGAFIFDKCTSYFDFWRCLNPWIRNCSEVARNATRDWGVLSSAMYCSCTRNRECVEKLNCFEERFNNALFKRCDALYKFNIEQKTLDKCHFLNDNVECWQTLMTSACGEDMGQLAKLIAMHRKRKHFRKHNCAIASDRAQYDGFKFSAKCPANLTVTLDSCHNQHVNHGRRLYFFDSSDFIADSSGKDVRKACRDYAKYKTCTATLQTECPEGVSAVYQYEYRLRTYNLKMDIICSHHHYEVYKTNLKCYQDVFLESQLTGCVPVWNDDVQPILDRTRAYDYYCRDTSNVRRVNRNLQKYISCYNTTFRGRCGQEAGDTMTALLQAAYRDPHYLMFRFRPECSLHRHLGAPAGRDKEEEKEEEEKIEGEQEGKGDEGVKLNITKDNKEHYSYVNKDTSSGCAHVKVVSSKFIVLLALLMLFSVF